MNSLLALFTKLEKGRPKTKTRSAASTPASQLEPQWELSPAPATSSPSISYAQGSDHLAVPTMLHNQFTGRRNNPPTVAATRKPYTQGHKETRAQWLLPFLSPRMSPCDRKQPREVPASTADSGNRA